MFAPFGALFQEIHTPVYPSIYDTLKVAMLLRHLWIVCSFLLAAAYASNLKAAFVIRSFEDIPESIQEISDWYGIPMTGFCPRGRKPSTLAQYFDYLQGIHCNGQCTRCPVP